MRKLIRKILKIIGSVLAVILLALAGYIIYLYASYHRIEDNLQLQVETTRGTANETTNETNNETTEANTLTTGKKYSALTYNIGFGKHRKTATDRKRIFRTDLQYRLWSLYAGFQLFHGWRKIFLGKK